ncbi:MAG TPA: hypothetical protein VFC60_00040 [Tissierellaceae bacterium]|nr:hypothetical protein [Tissierellaceae bacterium]
MDKELKELGSDNDNSLYDYVASNYYKMTKEQLKEFFLNMNYATFEKTTKEQFEIIENKAINYFIERNEE